ncbi:MAG: hypothetical protein KC561_15375, partial [Myxococcales bacterium]|nr:hypothetical protein [Myxococcales bacterium]
MSESTKGPRGTQGRAADSGWTLFLIGTHHQQVNLLAYDVLEREYGTPSAVTVLCTASDSVRKASERLKKVIEDRAHGSGVSVEVQIPQGVVLDESSIHKSLQVFTAELSSAAQAMPTRLAASGGTKVLTVAATLAFDQPEDVPRWIELAVVEPGAGTVHVLGFEESSDDWVIRERVITEPASPRFEEFVALGDVRTGNPAKPAEPWYRPMALGVLGNGGFAKTVSLAWDVWERCTHWFRIMSGESLPFIVAGESVEIKKRIALWIDLCFVTLRAEINEPLDYGVQAAAEAWVVSALGAKKRPKTPDGKRRWDAARMKAVDEAVRPALQKALDGWHSQSDSSSALTKAWEKLSSSKGEESRANAWRRVCVARANHAMAALVGAARRAELPALLAPVTPPPGSQVRRTATPRM